MNVVWPRTREVPRLTRMLSLSHGGGSAVLTGRVLLLQVKPEQRNPGGNSCNGKGKMMKDKGNFSMVLGRKGNATEGMVLSPLPSQEAS